MSQSGGTVTEVVVPDLGGAADVDVIEISVAVGDTIEIESTILTLESDKATIEVPSPLSGTVKALHVAVGATVNEGDKLLSVEGGEQAGVAQAEPESKQTEPKTNQASQSSISAPNTDVAPTESEINTEKSPAVTSSPSPAPVAVATASASPSSDADPLESNIAAKVHAGPAVRRLANELGVDLTKVVGTGPKKRILKEDVHGYIKQTLSKPAEISAGSGLPVLPEIDFSRWGEVEPVALTKIQRSSAQNLHRSWVNIPHVTQFDEADITELEAFRKSEGPKYKEQGVKITPLAFIIKAVAATLTAFPKFKSSMAADGETLIYKKYCHIGFAVDTPNGLVVPVLRDADTLSVSGIAEQLQLLSVKARDKKLTPQDMQGGCFTVSSLGGIGGTQFTPIVNWPEVAILGVSKSKQQPVWVNGEFVPRLVLPVSLSYDHRVIDGADAVRFTTHLTSVLSDIRRILL